MVVMRIGKVRKPRKPSSDEDELGAPPVDSRPLARAVVCSKLMAAILEARR